jgi:rhodanese-related sulfurtransferase
MNIVMEQYLSVIIAIAAFLAVKFFLFRDLSGARARELIDSGAVIIDVRTGGEYRHSHVESSINVPLHDIRNRIGEVVRDKNTVILLYCRSGNRSFTAKRILKKLGYKNVYNLGSLGRAKGLAA